MKTKRITKLYNSEFILSSDQLDEDRDRGSKECSDMINACSESKQSNGAITMIFLF